MGDGMVGNKLHIARFQPHIEKEFRAETSLVIKVEDGFFCLGQHETLVPFNRAKVIAVVERLQFTVSELGRGDHGVG